jgi:hypothetical protein
MSYIARILPVRARVDPFSKTVRASLGRLEDSIGSDSVAAHTCNLVERRLTDIRLVLGGHNNVARGRGPIRDIPLVTLPTALIVGYDVHLVRRGSGKPVH